MWNRYIQSHTSHERKHLSKKKNLMRENLTSWSSLWKGERKDYLWYRGEQEEWQTYISTRQAVKNKHWLSQMLKQQKTWIDSHIKAEGE